MEYTVPIAAGIGTVVVFGLAFFVIKKVLTKKYIKNDKTNEG